MSAYLAQQFGVIPMAKRVLLLAQEDKCYEKAVKFYPEIFEVKVFVRQNNQNNRFDLVA